MHTNVLKNGKKMAAEKLVRPDQIFRRTKTPVTVPYVKPLHYKCNAMALAGGVFGVLYY